jgi:hypothetical protein
LPHELIKHMCSEGSHSLFISMSPLLVFSVI